ncbi:MAG TPA: ABC transporter permease [Thermoplasmatales archaeon]|nr:ABC transporter permease [Thermoplasmatales archaeon]
MIKGLKAITSKEIKELVRDPRIILGITVAPLVMFLIMGYAMQGIFTQVEKSVEQIEAGIINLDEGKLGESLIENLTKLGVNVVELEYINESYIVQQMKKYNLTTLLVIPENFSENIENHTGVIRMYTVYGGSVMESAKTGRISTIIEQIKRIWSPDPFTVSENSIVKGKIIPVSPNVLSGLVMSQNIIIPIVIAIITLLSMQLAATSIATEKEEKTLETLLSLPIDRFSILVGKLFGSVFVAMIGAVAYLFGFNYYMNSFNAPTAGYVELSEIGLTPTPAGYILIGISFFVTLLFALSLAIIASAFTEDVRSAQALTGYIYPVIFIPMFLLMYTDISMLSIPVRVVIFAIPFSQPILAVRYSLSGNYLIIIAGIVYMSLLMVLILYFAAKFFATEKILTAKLTLKRMKR